MQINYFKQFDWQLFLLLFSIPCLSLVVLYSAGYDPKAEIKLAAWLPITLQSYIFLKQCLNFAIGICALLVALLFSRKFLFKVSVPFYLLGIILLILVLVMGSSSHGAQRWIPLGPMRFQPSEYVKVAVILFYAWFLAKFGPGMKNFSWKTLFAPVCLLLIPCGLILVQPDLGTTLSVAGIAVSMLLLAGVQKKVLLVVFAVGLLSVPFAWEHVLKPYQKKRVMTLFNPDADPFGQGYHIIQSKIAVGSGGLYGKGFLNGSQTQLEFLPEHNTDFIFSVLAEEWGFFGCSLVLLLYGLLISRLLWLAMKCEMPFQSYVCFGFAMFFLIHVFVNVGMVIGIMPVVGLPLPLFSYGGSAMLMVLLMGGIVLNISSKRGKW